MTATAAPQETTSQARPLAPAATPDAIDEIRALWLGNIVAIESWKTSLAIEPKDVADLKETMP
jgi:hypothetical protein